MDFHTLLLQLLCLVIFTRCSDLDITIDDFEIIDGIRVRKEITVNGGAERENTMQDGKEGDKENNDNEEEEKRDVYEDEVTDEDAPEEDKEITKHLPTTCHGKRCILVIRLYFIVLIN